MCGEGSGFFFEFDRDPAILPWPMGRGLDVMSWAASVVASWGNGMSTAISAGKGPRLRVRDSVGCRRLAPLVLAGLFGAVCASPTFATDRAWVGGTGNWSTAGNWSPNGVPTASDNAIVTTFGTVDGVVTYDYGGPSIILSTVRIDNTGTIRPPAFTVLSMSGNFPTRSLAANVEYVGYDGRGRINQSGATFNTTDFLYVGYNAGAQGVYSLSGVAGLTTLNANVGYSGSGTLTASSLSVHTANGETNIGFNVGATGVYNLSSVLNASGHVNVGIFGNGIFNQTGGSLTLQNGADLRLGLFAEGAGTMNLTNGRIELATNQSHFHVGLTGMGSVLQSGDAFVDSAGDLLVGSEGSSTGHYSLSDTATLISRHTIVGSAGTGTFVQTNGFHSPSQLTLGDLATGSGTYTHSGGTLFSFLGSTIGNRGTGVLHQSGGILKTGEFSHLLLGRMAGSQGTYNLSGTGQLEVPGHVYVGDAGIGTVSQTGGSVLVNGDVNNEGLILGRLATSQGTYLLSNDALLEVRKEVIIGEEGTATFTQNGGLFIVSDSRLTVGWMLGSSGSYVLAGGTLLVSSSGDVTVGIIGSGTFTHTGGTHTILGARGLMVPTGVYTFGGGQLNTPVINAGLNGRFMYTGGTLSVAELRLTGGKISLNNNGATRIQKLTFSGTTDEWKGQLDLHTSALVLQTTGAADKSARIPELLNQMAGGKSGGTWTGQGITSSAIPGTPHTSLALVDNADLGLTSFRGQMVDGDSLILTIARLGDATLDGAVDAFDLNKLAGNWQQVDKLWSGGDFTGDGKVDAFDLNLLAANWQFGTAGGFEGALATLSMGEGAPVPEPSGLAVLALGAWAFLGRRRRS